MKKSNAFTIKLNELSRMLLISSLSTCRFTILHQGHPLSQIILENDFVDIDHLTLLFQKIKAAKDGAEMEFSIEDEILIYTCMDVTCKSFLTEISDDLEEKNKDLIAATEADFYNVRNTLLQGCQIVMEGMRKSLKNHDRFMNRVHELENVLIIE